MRLNYQGTHFFIENFLRRNRNEVEVLINKKSTLTLNLNHFEDDIYNQTIFYVGKLPPTNYALGGAPRPTVDKINFLREFTPETNNGGRIDGFIGCISDIRIMDSPVSLKNSVKTQNIDACPDKEQ